MPAGCGKAARQPEWSLDESGRPPGGSAGCGRGGCIGKGCKGGRGTGKGARAGRRMALLRIATGITGRRHRKPSPERERIWADAWSSTGGIPQRVCLPSLSRICRKPASFRGAAPISALFVPAQGGPSWAGQPSAGPNGGRNGPMVSNVTAPFQAKRRRKRRRWLVVFSRG